jgi:comEA protein
MWKRLLSLAHRAGFTQSEAAVIVFLAAVLLAGATMRAVQVEHAPVAIDVRQSLAEQDSVFAAEALAQVQASTDSLGSAAAVVDMAGTGTANEALAIVDINGAPSAVLETLPGVGPATARNIIEHRRQHGPFTRIEDLMEVKGIGPKKFEKMRQFITVK